MQKTLFVVSRFIFASALMAVIMVVFWGFVLTINSNTDSKLTKTNKINDGKVLVANLNTLSDNDVSAKIDEKVIEADARPLLIKAYLEKYKSPLAPYSDLIFKLSETYGFEYYWIVAIGQQESNLCKKIPEDSYNCWGYGINSAGTLKFDNYELALKSFAEYLKREYFDKGLNTPELIMKKYCPHSNGSWAYGVNHFIEEIETGKF